MWYDFDSLQAPPNGTSVSHEYASLQASPDRTSVWLAHVAGACGGTSIRVLSLGLRQPCCRVPAGHSKEELRRVVRRLGTACAVLQLGAAFAACRALRTSKVRQRLVAMDLR